MKPRDCYRGIFLNEAPHMDDNLTNKATIVKQIRHLEKRIALLKDQLHDVQRSGPSTVSVPDEISALFEEVEVKVDGYFSDFHFDPDSGEINVHGQRYVLFRTDSLSYEFIDLLKDRYANRPESEAISIGNNFLYDNAKVIGKKDALAFHKQLKLKDPIEKLSAGPVHFAYTGWANVEIFPESNPVPNEDFFLKFRHHNSFEAQAWIKAGRKSETPVCTMNCGYSAGWCEESFGLPLTTVEISCEAQGADACIFIMAPSNRIEEYVAREIETSELENVEIPVFFKRQHIVEQLKDSLAQKEVLIQEIHHRVKNNLQVIASLLRLQMAKQSEEKVQDAFESSINRVNTMAAVHELMYREADFHNVDMSTYFAQLTNSLAQFYTLDKPVELIVNIDVTNKTLGLDQSIPIGLIMNEVMCNAYRHGLKEGGKFTLDLSETNGKYVLIMGDDGPGYVQRENNNGLGLSLIDILCDQLDADKSFTNDSNGVHYRIEFGLE